MMRVYRNRASEPAIAPRAISKSYEVNNSLNRCYIVLCCFKIHDVTMWAGPCQNFRTKNHGFHTKKAQKKTGARGATSHFFLHHLTYASFFQKNVVEM